MPEMTFKEKFEDKMAHMLFTSKSKNRVFLKLAALMENEVTIMDAIEALWMQASEDGKKPGDFGAVVLRNWAYTLFNGGRFYNAVQGWVPDSEVPIIRAGEDAGRLTGALKNSVLLNESVGKITMAIIIGLIYPALLLSVVIGYLVLFSVKLVPALNGILPEDQWQGAAHYMAGVAAFVTNDSIYVGIAFVMFLIFVFWSLPRLTGNIRVKLDGIPPWSLYRMMTGAGFMLSVSALYAAGAKEPEIMRILMKDAQPYYAERLDGALQYMLNGADLGTALMRAGHKFPEAETVQDLRTYSKLSAFQEVLDRIARQWIETSIAKVKAQTNVLQMGCLFLMTAVIIFIISSIFGLQSQISAGAGH